MSNGGPTTDPSKAFLERLLTSIRRRHRLDDPRNVEVLQRWVAICKGLPDQVLMAVVPEALRGLLRNPDVRDGLMACGISPAHPLQHESIAPYVISYRRYMAARGEDPRDEQARRTVETLRAELGALREQFNSVFDQIAGLEMERERLSTENVSLQQELLAARLRGDEAEKRLAEARAKAFRLFRLYLFMLKEERTRLSNDPNRERLLTAEIAVETHAATLDALDCQEDAEAQAVEILGPRLFEEYFHGAPDPARDISSTVEAMEQAEAIMPEAPQRSQPVAGAEGPPPNVHVLRPRPAKG